MPILERQRPQGQLVVISSTRNPHVKCAKSCEIPPARPALGQTVPCRRPTTTTSGPDGNRQDHAKAEAKCQLAFEHENRMPNFFTSAAICTRSTCARPTFNQLALLVEGPSPTLGFPTAIVLSIRLYSLMSWTRTRKLLSCARWRGARKPRQETALGRRAACMWRYLFRSSHIFWFRPLPSNSVIGQISIAGFKTKASKAWVSFRNLTCIDMSRM